VDGPEDPDGSNDSVRPEDSDGRNDSNGPDDLDVFDDPDRPNDRDGLETWTGLTTQTGPFKPSGLSGSLGSFG